MLNVALTPVGLLLPTAAESFVEGDEAELFVACGIAESDLCIEIATLGVQQINVANHAIDVLQACEIDSQPVQAAAMPHRSPAPCGM